MNPNEQVHLEPATELDIVTITITGRKGVGKSTVALALVWFIKSAICRIPPYLKSRIRVVETQ